MYEDIVDILANGGIKSPRLEARMILERTTDPRKVRHILSRRLKGTPLDKVLGRKPFYKSEFIVNKHVLSPRPETEFVVEKAVEVIKNHKSKNPNHQHKVLDLGVGSGNILLSILKEHPCTIGIGVDVSPEALAVARRNTKKLIEDHEKRVTLIQSDWFATNFFKRRYWFLTHGFDIIVSNPPYIPKDDIRSLDSAVRDHDPMLALDGGIDGLRSYKRIAEITPELLKKEGRVILEIGINQADDVIEIFQGSGLELVEVIKDLAGIDRCLVFKN
jgi:release factor glutamine methyltransferase